MDSVGPIPPPPDFKEYAVRLRLLYSNARSSEYKNLSVNATRKIPYAYWLKGSPPLPVVEPGLVAKYWSETLPSALESGARRAKRWLLPLVHTYCEFFSPEDGFFLDYSRKISGLLNVGNGAFVEQLLNLQRDISFFSPDSVADRMANLILISPVRFDQVFVQRGLWSEIIDSQLGSAIFESALFKIQRLAPDSSPFFKLLDLAGSLTAPVVKTRYRIAFANSMLSPWARRVPDPKLRSVLIDNFLSNYGDPVDPQKKEYQWRDVDSAARGVLLDWINGDTLRGFIHILGRTKDNIWRYRRKFWMAYYEAGYVKEVWLALGIEALNEAERLKSSIRGLRYGKLEGGVQSNHSVLLLKIGSLVFTEWSHNGSLRVHNEDDRNAPALYRDMYSGTDLRDAGSLDFHDGANDRPQLAHMGSDRGTWQRKARDFIRRHAGIHLPDSAIV